MSCEKNCLGTELERSIRQPSDLIWTWMLTTLWLRPRPNSMLIVNGRHAHSNIHNNFSSRKNLAITINNNSPTSTPPRSPRREEGFSRPRPEQEGFENMTAAEVNNNGHHGLRMQWWRSGRSNSVAAIGNVAPVESNKKRASLPVNAEPSSAVPSTTRPSLRSSMSAPVLLEEEDSTQEQRSPRGTTTAVLTAKRKRSSAVRELSPSARLSSDDLSAQLAKSTINARRRLTYSEEQQLPSVLRKRALTR